jgi:hypothetical protein
MPEPTVIDQPVTIKTEPAMPAPLEDAEFSKSNFNKAMEDAKGEPEKPVEVPDPVKQDKVATPEEKKPTEPEATPKKGIPEELLTGKKEEPPVDEAIAQIDAMVLPKNAKPEQVASFGKLKEEAKKQIESKLARITELEQKTSDTASKAEIEAAKERVKVAEERAAAAEQTVERIAFTETPKFKQFLAEETSSLDGAKAYLAGTEINPDIIDVAARLTGSKRLEVLRNAGIEGETSGAVLPYLAQYDAIQRNKTAALDNWKAESNQWQQGQKAKEEAQQAQQKAEEDRVWSSVISEAENEFLPFRKVKDNPEWNTQSEELKNGAKQIFNGEGVDLKTVATTIAKGKAYDVLNDVLQNVIGRVNELTAENTRLKAARPDAGSSQTSGTQVKPDENMTDEDRRKQSFNQAMQTARGGA